MSNIAKERYAEMLEMPSEKVYGVGMVNAPLLTPGQHLHAVFAAHFQGGGWVEAPDWADYDAAGKAEWEAMSLVIGRNLKAARTAPDLLAALRPFATITVNGCDHEGFAERYPAFAALVEAARSAITKATALTQPKEG